MSYDKEHEIKPFKHPKIYDDLVLLYHFYHNQHERFPKSFRFTTGERILNQLDDCMHMVIECNLLDKTNHAQCELAVEKLRSVRSTLIVVRSFLHNAWRLKVVSHKALTEFHIRLDVIEKQVTKWQQWFVQKTIDNSK